MLHNSNNLGQEKGVWGVAGGKYGLFTCDTCHSRDANNIKRIKDTITAPQGMWSSSKTATLPVTFMNLTGYGNPAAHTSSTNICEVCHSKTAVHRYEQSVSPHNGRVDCTSCHLHRDGFKKPGNCDSCHGAPPATAEHDDHFAVGSASYGQAAVASTRTDYGFSCGVCHSGTHRNGTAMPATAEVAFAGIATQAPRTGSGVAAYAPGATSSLDNPGNGRTFSYSDGTCSNIYCHGNFAGSGKNATPTWTDSDSGACGTCHDATNNPNPASGSHTRHAWTGMNANFLKCSVCHASVSGDFATGYAVSDKSRHVNGAVDVQFDLSDARILPASSYSIPSATVAPSDGISRAYGTCNNNYCHSIGQTATGEPLTGQPGEYKESPRWGVALGINLCGTCHEGGHGNAISSGSHGKHLTYSFRMGVGQAAACTICHKWNATASYGECTQCHNQYQGVRYHVNKQVDVRFDPYWGAASYSGTPAPGDGFGVCANTYCHSNGTGGTKNSGETRAVAANSSPVWGGMAPCGSCHGWPPLYASGSPKANSHGVHVVKKGIACKSCHFSTVSSGLDPEAHVNGTYDVVADGHAGVSFFYQYAADGGTCDNVSCHGSGRKWGSYGAATFLSFRSASDLNNTIEPMPNGYLTTGSYLGTTSYSTSSGTPGRRAMNPGFGATEESVTQTLASSTGNYRVAQFVSPPLAKAVSVISNKTYSISIRNQKSSLLSTAKLRYALYQWKANDSQGTNFRTIAQDTVNISTAATNRTISFTTDSAVTFAAGDRIVCEIEINAAPGLGGGTVTNSWGNSNSNYAGLDLPVTMYFLTEN